MPAKSKKTAMQKDQASEWNWRQQTTCLIGSSPNIKGSEKIASFDMDDTLLRTKSGAKFAQNAADWVFWHQSVPGKLKSLQKDGYKLVIMSNQLGVTKGKTNVNDLKTKIEAIAAQVGVELQCYLALDDDQFRKPSVSMWTLLQKNNDGVKINKEKSFYCGDAAGRKTGGHKDFSDSDLKFGLNVGVKFETPENTFLGSKEKVKVAGFDPHQIPENGVLIEGKGKVDFVPKEMVLFVGSPGSGKSTFWKNYMSKYERINRDTLKTKQKCYKKAQEAINQGKSVIIDNTNPTVQDRNYFIKLAQKHGYKVRCFLFLTSKEICFHNDYQRVANNAREHLSGKAGSIPIHGWFKNMEEPTLAQGFYQINKVNFIAKFNDQKDRQAYQQFSKK